MSDAQKRLDEYESKPTAELIHNAEQLIYAMCKDGSAKHWRMSVPVSPNDSDIVLTAALNSAKQQIADLESQLAEVRRRVGGMMPIKVKHETNVVKVEVMQVVCVQSRVGTGESDDPVRIIHEYFDLDGRRLARVDQTQEASL